MNKKVRKHRSVYELIYKGEVIDEAETVIQATELLKEYNIAFHTNSIKLKFRYDK
jgi:hypothetical protein